MLIANIQAVVAHHYGLPCRLMRSRSQYWSHAHPRQVAMYLAHQITNRQKTVIGREFNRDHTTVLHAIRAVAARRAADPQLDADIRAIEAAL
jgi:chromosomal replication initiator protein